MTAPACHHTGPYAYDPHVHVLWTTTVDDIHAPTPTEVTAAVDLVRQYRMTDLIGWEVSTDIIREPPWGRFEQQRVGGQSVPGDSQMVFPAGRDGDDVRQLWQRGDLGYVLLLPSGSWQEHPTAPLNVYRVRVAQITQMQRLRTGRGSLLLVTFVVRAVAENVTTVETP